MKYSEEVKRIYRTEGLKGFLRGYQGMLIRDGPGFAIYFTTYEFLKRQAGVSDQDKLTEKFKQMPSLQYKISLLLCGGFSGVVTWTLCFPADTLKTRVQTQPTNCTKSLFTLASEIYRARGILGLYNGIHV